MARVFPLSPTLNQEVTVGSKKFQWDGTLWKRVKVTESTVQEAATTTEAAAQVYTDTAISGLASESFVNNAVSTAVSNLVDSSPATLDTLNELAAALGDDPNFATTVTNSIAAKADASHTHSVSDVTNLQTSLDSKTNKNQTVVTKTSSYTVQSSDNQSLILCNGTFTVSISSIPVGGRVDFINIGTGTITLDGGMYTLVGKDGALTLDTQYAAATIVGIDTFTAVAVGSLA